MNFMEGCTKRNKNKNIITMMKTKCIKTRYIKRKWIKNIIEPEVIQSRFRINIINYYNNECIKFL